jgi:hypothetical protein
MLISVSNEIVAYIDGHFLSRKYRLLTRECQENNCIFRILNYLLLGMLTKSMQPPAASDIIKP